MQVSVILSMKQLSEIDLKYIFLYLPDVHKA